MIMCVRDRVKVTIPRHIMVTVTVAVLNTVIVTVTVTVYSVAVAAVVLRPIHVVMILTTWSR